MAKARAKGRPAPDSTIREVVPNAGKTMQALRELGYDSFASVMDLIDNSIDAGAERVEITVKESGTSLLIDILDDGRGMDEKTLAEALRLGSDTEHDAKKDLGKFGMGLVTASLSMARTITVITRQQDKPAYEATLDLDTIERENKFIIHLDVAKGRDVVGTLDQHGTLVKLSRIDRVNDRNVARFSQNLRTKLGQVYRHFLSKGVSITVNKRHVQRYDPLLIDHPQTEVKLDTKIDLGDGTDARLVVVELPELGTQGDADANIFPHNSGFYVVRNGREIIAGDTFGFYRHHHSYSHFRAELSYSGDSTVFHEDVKKASINPDNRLLEKLHKLTDKLIAESGRRGRDVEKPEHVKLSHRSSSETINSRLAVLVNGPTKEVLAQATAGVLAAPVVENGQPAEAPRKRGRPTKEEMERRVAEEKAMVEAAKTLPPVPAVEFIEVDAGDTGRFFTSEIKGPKLTIAYNTRHPLVRMVADANQKQAHAILDLVSFALAKAEGDIPEGKKLVNRACDYLKVLAAPAVSKGQGAGHAAK